MFNSKVKSTTRKPLREGSLAGTSKIIKEINKITNNQLRPQPVCPLQKIVVRRSVPDFKTEVLGKRSSISRAFRSQASQTDLGGPSEHDAIIRYPSSKKFEVKSKREVGSQVEYSPREKQFLLSPTRSAFLESSSLKLDDSSINHVKINKIPVIKSKLKTISEKIDPLRAPPSYKRGVVPKYLLKLKEDLISNGDNGDEIKTIMTRGSTLIDLDLAEREEKNKVISSWHEKYQQMVSDLNSLTA